MRRIIFSRLSLLVLLGAIFTSCKKEGPVTEQSAPAVTESFNGNGHGFADNDMVMFWNEKASIILNAPNTPPAQQRYFAIIQIAVHDALNSVKPKYNRYALLNTRDKHANIDAAVASAAYWTMKELNIGVTHPLDLWLSESLALLPDGDAKERGKVLGKKAADAIIAKRSTDNFAQANIQIPLPDGLVPGAYKSTLPFSNPGMPKIKALHQWGTMMTPFVTQSNSQFRTEPPYPVNSNEYTQEYNEVKLKGGRFGHTRTAEEDEIGRFWVERSAIGWNRFARNVINSKKMDAWKTARLFALMHTAMTDAVSGCFESKYHYFYWRPETAVRLGDTDGNENTTGNAAWLPSYVESPNAANPSMNINTPPIPDYPSAHATFGGAAAEILKQFFGSDAVSVAQTSTTTPGVVRNYTSLAVAARDNSLSRIYVGYHFRKACLSGELQGKQVAQYVFENSFEENDDE